MFGFEKRISPLFAAGLFAMLLGALMFAGCQRKERVVDVQTPAGDVQVDRNIDTGAVEVEVERE